MRRKSKAQLSYEAYCKRFPVYADGSKRLPFKAFEKNIKRIDRETASRCRNQGTDWLWRTSFERLQKELLEQKPHLANHKHCGLCPDSEDRPRHKVVFRNGHVMWSTWYKIPKTDADARQAAKEQKWLESDEGRAWYAETFKPTFITEIANALAA